MKAWFFRFSFLVLGIFSTGFADFKEDFYLYLLGLKNDNVKYSDSNIIDSILETYREKKALIFCENCSNKLIFSESLINYNYWDLGIIANKAFGLINDFADEGFSNTVYIYKPKGSSFIRTCCCSAVADLAPEVIRSHRLAKTIAEKTGLLSQKLSEDLPYLIIKTRYDDINDMRVSVISIKDR